MLQVVAFCDVDMKKISKGFYTYEESDVCVYCVIAVHYNVLMMFVQIIPKPKVPIIHFRETHPPLLICVQCVSEHMI